MNESSSRHCFCGNPKIANRRGHIILRVHDRYCIDGTVQYCTEPHSRIFSFSHERSNARLKQNIKNPSRQLQFLASYYTNFLVSHAIYLSILVLNRSFLSRKIYLFHRMSRSLTIRLLELATCFVIPVLIGVHRVDSATIRNRGSCTVQRCGLGNT